MKNFIKKQWKAVMILTNNWTWTNNKSFLNLTNQRKWRTTIPLLRVMMMNLQMLYKWRLRNQVITTTMFIKTALRIKANLHIAMMKLNNFITSMPKITLLHRIAIITNNLIKLNQKERRRGRLKFIKKIWENKDLRFWKTLSMKMMIVW